MSEIVPPHPRERHALVGHRAAEAEIAAALAAGRVHHAWLIGGPQGIGKATLAYRFARALLDGAARERRSSLAVDASSRTARQVAARSHPNLMVLERPAADGEKAAPKTIPVEAVRKALGFFASTAADGGHRVCLIDAAEDLNTHGLNALLKTVEEPPENATILIVSHAPQRLLPTIRSRCRKLTLAPLGEAEVSEVLAGLGPDAARLDPALVARAAGRAEGSVGRALALLDARRLATLAELETILEGLPAYPTTRVLALADKLADKRGEETFRLALDRVLAWSAERLRARAADGPARLAWLAAVCEKVADEARLVEAYNLDRRAFVLSAVGDLAEAVRRAG